MTSSNSATKYTKAEESSPDPNHAAFGPEAVGPSRHTSASSSDKHVKYQEAAERNLEITLQGGESDAGSTASEIKRHLDDLRKSQKDIRVEVDERPRLPKPDDFPSTIPVEVIDSSIRKELEHCIVLLIHRRKTETSLRNLARWLRESMPESAFLLIRGTVTEAILPESLDSVWIPSDMDESSGLLRSSLLILEIVIRDGLIRKCFFLPRNIAIIGESQGGTVSLALAASWNTIEFGGIISIGGPLSPLFQTPSPSKARTPVLVLGGEMGNVVSTALRQIQDNFLEVEDQIKSNSEDTVPKSKEEIKPILDFLAHRLQREEWGKQAVISFDGGGIRGYGSLLILQALMNKIGEEEQRLGETESSFSPCMFRPTRSNSSITPNHDDYLNNTQVGDVVASHCKNLPNSAKFLPCHYFNYAAGTSTGGLISIVLLRFRMSVDDCIKEYKSLGEEIFGHPRPFAMGALLWHKFDSKVLERVIRDVTARHAEQREFGINYAMDKLDDDMCKCMVVAYGDREETESPYLFRTYRTEAPPPPKKNQRRYGEPSALPIFQVARATSAAPNYFRPITIETENGKEKVRFKDGGFGSNNPSEQIYRDVVHVNSTQNVGPFVSIGAGTTPMHRFSRQKSNFSDAMANAKAALKHVSRTYETHERMLDHSRERDQEKFPYYRFDGGDRLGEVKLDE